MGCLKSAMWRVLALCAVIAAVLILTSDASAHPKPGAHADVRIRIDPDAVRVEVLMNILFADQIVNVQRAARDNVGSQEVEPLQLALAEYFGAARAGAVTMLVDRGNRVQIDGIDVTPVIEDLRVVYPEPERRPGFIQNPALLLPQIHVVARYPCTTPPKQVGLVWGSYPRDFIAVERDIAPITDIEAVLTHGASLELVKFTKAEPEVVWHARSGAEQSAFAQVPVPARSLRTSAGWPAGTAACAAVWLTFMIVLAAKTRGRVRLKPAAITTLLCAAIGLLLWPIESLRIRADGGAIRLADDAALEVFQPLHANIYRAFDYARESDVYDALARSVDGALLDTVYGNVYASLILREEGGALCRVRAVTTIQTRVLPARADLQGAEQSAFSVWCSWRVEGVVYHWGHSHTRVNEYVAEYDVAAVEQGWRIVGVRPLEQRRIETAAQAASPAAVAGPKDPADIMPPESTPGQKETGP